MNLDTKSDYYTHSERSEESYRIKMGFFAKAQNDKIA
jgi:hypothetical protein